MGRSRLRPLGRSLSSLPRVIPAWLGLTLDIPGVFATGLRIDPERVTVRIEMRWLRLSRYHVTTCT